MLDRHVLNEYPVRIGALVVASTLVLTSSFFGFISLVSGTTGGIEGRVPYYVLATAVVFVVTLVTFDDRGYPGVPILVTTIGVAIAAFSFVTLAVEGAVFALTFPGEVFGSHLVIYLTAAGLICTGFGYWVLHHWREFGEPHPEPMEFGDEDGGR